MDRDGQVFCDWLVESGFDPGALTPRQWETLNALYCRAQLFPLIQPARGTQRAALMPIVVTAVFCGLVCGWAAARSPWFPRSTANAAARVPPRPVEPASISPSPIRAQSVRAAVPEAKRPTAAPSPSTRTPAVPPPATGRFLARHRVEWATIDGRRLQLGDESIWESRSADRSTAANWNQGQWVEIRREESGPWRYRLFNRKRRELIQARRIQ